MKTRAESSQGNSAKDRFQMTPSEAVWFVQERTLACVRRAETQSKIGNGHRDDEGWKSDSARSKGSACFGRP